MYFSFILLNSRLIFIRFIKRKLAFLDYHQQSYDKHFNESHNIGFYDGLIREFHYIRNMMGRATLFVLISLLFSEHSFAQQQVEQLALNPKKPLTQYIIDNWATEEGLPSKTLTKVLQTKDGYLWIGTYNGLLQFDGVNFKTYSKADYPIFRTNSFIELQESADGKLYIGTGASGLLTFENGKFTHLGEMKGGNRPIESLCFDEGEKVWVGTRGGGVYIYEKGKEPVKYEKIPLLNNISVSAIIKDDIGSLWYGTEGNGVICIRGEETKVFNTKNGLYSNHVLDVFADHNGTIWIGTTKGVCYIDVNGVHKLEGTENYPVNRIIEDNYHSIWVASTKGLFRFNRKALQLEFISDVHGLPHRNVVDINTDREGSLWVASYRAGLCRLKDARFENYSVKDGLSSKTISTVKELSNNRVLIGTGAGKLHVIKDHKVYDLEIKTRLTNNRIKHVNEDSRGNILVSTYSGMLVIKPNGQERLFDTRKGFPDNQTRTTFIDSQEFIWVGSRAGGAVRLDPNSGDITIYDRNRSLSSNFIMAIEEDRNGNMLFGLNDAGMDIMASDGTTKNYNIDQLGSNLIFNFHVDDNNNIWIASNAGISLLQPNGKVTRFTTSEGMVSDIIFDILEDDNNKLWFTSSEGVFTIPKEQFFNIEEGKRQKLEPKQYGPEDGMLEKECTGATQSEIGTDGKFYFPTLAGLSIFDPSYSIAEIPNPPVYINTLLIDGKVTDLYQDKIELPSESKRITIGFTGLNLTAPHNLKFQYRLEGYEDDWVNAGTERQAVYTQVNPGNNIFKVRVSHKKGIWNDEIATLNFFREPQLTEKPIFYIGIFILFAALGYAFYLWRVRRISAKNKELEAIVQQRTQQITKQRDKLELAYNDIRTVSTIGQEVTAALDINQLTHTVYDNVKTLMSADVFGIGLLNSRKQQLEFRNLIRMGETSPSQIERLEDKFYLSVKCLESKSPIFINSAREEYGDFESYLNTLNRTEEDESKSAIFVPLLIEGEPIGIMTVQSMVEEAYKQQHLTILQALASYISVALDNSRAYEEIKSKNHQITNSIRYAETIQQAVLPASVKMNEALHEYFVIYKPKDIVSGDFYWFSHQGDRIYIAAVDCTGHGVPGAFMSMIGSSLLDEIVNVEKVYAPADILEQLNENIRVALKQGQSGNDDGMDLALCLLEPGENFQTKLTFAGAKRPLYYAQKGQILEVKGVNKSIGGVKKDKGKRFENHEILLDAGCTFYLATDGFIDQHSPDGKRLGSTRLKELLQNCLSLELEDQKGVILQALERHQKFQDQRDDITMVGVRV